MSKIYLVECIIVYLNMFGSNKKKYELQKKKINKLTSRILL